jgi:hypothetical protein
MWTVGDGSGNLNEVVAVAGVSSPGGAGNPGCVIIRDPQVDDRWTREKKYG